MHELKQLILSKGKIISSDILDVSSFINRQIDCELYNKMATHVANKFANDKIDKVLTIESSGIAFGFAIGSVLNVPLVFAKKIKASIDNNKCYTAAAHSFTHDLDFFATVSSDFIIQNEKILIVDDFLATGNAFLALTDICNQAKADIVGFVSIIEKGYQGGGDLLREKGFKVESLAIIDYMSNDREISFR